MTGKSPPFSLASTLAFLAGLGLTLMVISAALGVIGSAGGISLGVLFAGRHGHVRQRHCCLVCQQTS